MKYYRINRTVHKWFGIIFALALLNFSITGLLLLEKKNFDWMQPPTQTGSEGSVGQFITNQHLFKIVFDKKHPDFKNMDDIDRVDFRPGKRVFKVRSKNNYSEIQVDAVNGKILNIAKRNSDKIEAWHDGSMFGEFVHKYIMSVVAIVTVMLTITGLYLWLVPVIRRRENKRTTSQMSR